MQDSFSTYHPAINFFYFLVVVLFSMFFQHPAFMAVGLASAIIYSFITLGWRKAVKFNFLGMTIILIIAVVSNPLFNHYGVHILGYLGNGNPITLESITYGFVMGIMLITVIIWFASYNKVMTSDKFIYLFGRIIPAMSLILSMVLRFVPRFRAQMKVIGNGQKCIGRDSSNGNLFERLRHGVRILSILVTWALENAIETSDSMRARGYGLKGRTAFSIYRFDRRDARTAALMGLVLGVTAAGIAQGAAFVQYNPYFKVQGIWPLTGMGLVTYIAYGLFCLSPVIVDGLDALKWRGLRSGLAPGESMTGAGRRLRVAMFGDDAATLAADDADAATLAADVTPASDDADPAALAAKIDTAAAPSTVKADMAAAAPGDGSRQGPCRDGSTAVNDRKGRMAYGNDTCD